MAALAGTAVAAEVQIQASFAPSALDPTRNEFTNDTPNGGLCVRPNLCGPGEKSVLLPITVRYAEMRPFAGADHEARISVPSTWRRVVLTHADSGRTAETEWRVSFLGATYYLTRDARETTGNDNVSQAHHQLWQGNGWSEPPPGCGRMNYAEAGGTSWRFGWRYPEAATTCVKRPRHLIDDGMQLREVSLGYTMRSPNPLAMEAGIYTGQLQLRVGPGGDFDFGTNTVASDNELIVHFTLTVTHAFQVTFPQAGPKVSLAPAGGWSQWTRHGTPPARLQQELPFLLTTSNEFSVKMRCQHDSGGRCGIANASTGAVVPIDVDVTMPGMRDMRSGAFAQNTPLVSERSGQVAPRFTPQSYLQNRQARLRFAANGPAMTEMLKAPASRWQGDVTVVFDSEP
ncbi:hypothetical protein [Stenotrophomonas sp. 24(2023)]|uniref:hypothetical protein n=1 Tax=Stenotrophomonas sp. 24(2023) TaxID=3068324 RepID=UPI0027E17471|nr:hypothetical protein [Stenotrophomonas sp. 24(2023)]WMJ67819.1 hypothetical protein Q9R17_11365 [Stenotrophomonas sp. 24(2023)]